MGKVMFSNEGFSMVFHCHLTLLESSKQQAVKRLARFSEHPLLFRDLGDFNIQDRVIHAPEMFIPA